MSLINAYQAALKRGDIQDDPEQRSLLQGLQTVADEIVADQRWYRCLLPKKALKGLYIVGPVGVGKTYMMDLFYHYLPEKRKKRLHFSHFMQQIDHKLRFLQGHRDPLLLIAEDFAKAYRVLCLDEFIVADVAHAMILAELLAALFAHKVVLIATSNTRIDDLYRGGANRERFLPAIALLHQQTEERVLHSSIDYRLGRPLALHAYLYPLNAATHDLLEKQFQMLAVEAEGEGDIVVQSRSIAVVKVSQAVVWFEFSQICAMPRCQLDYIELADRYHTIFVANIPMLSQQPSNTAVVLLIQMVDVLYDRGVRLIVSAAVKADELYGSGPMLSEFARTLSRLEEMQSSDYLDRHCAL
jgi:cell division protein ZapE